VYLKKQNINNSKVNIKKKKWQKILGYKFDKILLEKIEILNIYLLLYYSMHNNKEFIKYLRC
jgi:hypothetical protein